MFGPPKGKALGAKSLKSKIVVVTCYDATFAKLCGNAGVIDFVLVGDSLGMVIAGESSTLSVTMDDMIFHTRAVRRGLQSASASSKPLLMADLPAGTYVTPSQALTNAQLLRDAGADIIKVEGPCYDVVRALTSSGFKVCAHIGLTPQSIQEFKVQGKTPEAAERLRTEALELEEAGAEWIVFEMIPAELARSLTESLRIPTIGIGAGVGCSGQVLVLYDLLGLNPDFSPKFLRKFADGAGLVDSALKTFAQNVRDEQYPDRSHSFS